MVTSSESQYGACQTKIDFSSRTAEPRDEVRGFVARTTFYMFDRYRLNMSRQQQQILMVWSKQYPVTDWERERNARIARLVGHSNEFVTGERLWAQGYKLNRPSYRNNWSISISQTGLNERRSVNDQA